MACKSSNSVEQDKERGQKQTYGEKEEQKHVQKTDKERPHFGEQAEPIYHIATEAPALAPKNRKESKKMEKSKSDDSDDFKMQINSFYDNLYRMKNDLTKQTKPKSRWIKIIKEREF